jgi:hypothetical protein
MPTLRFVLSMAMVVVLGAGLSAQNQAPTKKEKIIGVWEWRQEWGGIWHFVPRTGPSTIEITKDGKIKTSDKVEGTYEVDGDLLKAKLADKTVTWEVGRLDDQELVLVEGKLGLVEEKDKYSMRWFNKK